MRYSTRFSFSSVPFNFIHQLVSHAHYNNYYVFNKPQYSYTILYSLFFTVYK